MKRIRISLTLRIFLTTAALLIAACAITYGTIAYLTPITFTAIMEDELAQSAGALIALLEAVGPEECAEPLDDFVRQTGARVLLTDAYGAVLYSTVPQDASSSVDTMVAAVSEGASAASATTYEKDYEVSIVQNFAASSEVVEGTAMSSMQSFAFADGSWAWITIEGGTRAVNQAVEALGRVLPFLAGIVLLISLAGSLVYARIITRPVVAISRIARRMAALDFGARWRGGRGDEIGDLGDSLNLLSGNLSRALGELEAANRRLQSDIDRERAIERQRMAFFAAASHELKTPITILKGQLSGMLARVGIYQDREKYLARALAVTGRMEELVREILAINRIGANDFAVMRQPVDLFALVQRQLTLDMELLEQRGLRLETRIEPGAFVRGDEALLARALDNVLANAMLYSPEGATVSVSVEGGVLTVENGGVSIPEDALPRLFEAFYRVEQSRNRKSGGSGLGLYLVKSILDLHGAACKMENVDGGVRFTATFEPSTA